MKLQLQSQECPLQLRVPLLRWCVLIVTKVYPSVHHIFWECASLRHLRDGSGQVPPSPVVAWSAGISFLLWLRVNACFSKWEGFVLLKLKIDAVVDTACVDWFLVLFRASTSMLGWRTQNSMDSWALQGQVLYMFDVDNISCMIKPTTIKSNCWLLFLLTSARRSETRVSIRLRKNSYDFS